MFKEMEEMQTKIESGSVVGSNKLPDFTRGILQAIGFKEFNEYLNTPTVNAEVRQKLMKDSLERMMISTRQYARKQVSWIQNKLVPELEIEHEKGTAAIYTLDANDPADWILNVGVRSKALTTSFLLGNSNDVMSHFEISRKGSSTFRCNFEIQEWIKHTCEICQTKDGLRRSFNGDLEWKTHLQCNQHRKNLSYVKRIRIN